MPCNSTRRFRNPVSCGACCLASGFCRRAFCGAAWAKAGRTEAATRQITAIRDRPCMTTSIITMIPGNMPGNLLSLRPQCPIPRTPVSDFLALRRSLRISYVLHETLEIAMLTAVMTTPEVGETLDHYLLE